MKEQTRNTLKGWLALSPLIVFLLVYLVTSVIASDFYSVPIVSAFLIASCYAICITRERGVERRLSIFSRGAGDRNILTMLWIFVLAGAFASTAKQIGAIDATVDITLRILPGKLLYAGIFLASCFISLAIGTSVGTIAALVPVTASLASQADISVPFLTAIVVGGAFFGDNLSFISDTTIAATKTQGCEMRDKFKVNILITAPAALIATIIYVIIAKGGSPIHVNGPLEWVKLIPYLAIIVMACAGTNVLITLASGIVLCAVIGFACGSLNWIGWLRSIGEGVSGMGNLIIVTMLAGGMLELIRHGGGIDFILNGLSRRIRGKRGAEFGIAALVSLVNICTANNTIAIITTGSIAKEMAQKYGVDPRKSASILDTFSCVIQGILPYGAQLLMASGLAAVSATEIIPYLYYPLILFFFAILAIALRYPKKYS